MSDTSNSVLGTPPRNTFEITDLPFTTLAAAVAPQWGETIMRLTKDPVQSIHRCRQEGRHRRGAGTDEAGHAFQFEAGRVFRSEAGHPWRQSHGSI
jgi:hypothetical protein